MRRRTPKPPKMRHLLLVAGSLRANIPSTEPVYTPRESLNGVLNLRYQAETSGTSWVVDIYLGQFYRAQVGNQSGEVFHTIPSLLGFLLRSLGCTQKTGEETPVAMPSQILKIQTIEEMNRSILLQRTTSRKVMQEMDEIAKGVITLENQDDDEYLARMWMERECKLLKEYAALPTLIEYDRSPALRGVMEPGATFAVTAIVGEVILANVRALADIFTNAHRDLLFVMLQEIDKPESQDDDLVATFIRCMKIELAEAAAIITPEERTKLLRAMLSPLAEAMIMVAEQHQLIEEIPDEGFVITANGRRVMLHLFSAQQFILAVMAAHTSFQNSTTAGAIA